MSVRGNYFGPPVNRVARLVSAAHGGQVLLSLPTQGLVRDQLPTGAPLPDADRRLHQAHLDAARSRLGDDRWEEALAEGRAMALERVTDYALEEAGEILRQRYSSRAAQVL